VYSNGAPVGRKTRRAQGSALEFRCYAPVLSRDPSRGIAEDRCRTERLIYRSRQMRNPPTERLNPGATIQLEKEAISAPSFSPYQPWASFRRIAVSPFRHSPRRLTQFP